MYKTCNKIYFLEKLNKNRNISSYDNMDLSTSNKSKLKSESIKKMSFIIKNKSKSSDKIKEKDNSCNTCNIRNINNKNYKYILNFDKNYKKLEPSIYFKFCDSNINKEIREKIGLKMDNFFKYGFKNIKRIPYIHNKEINYIKKYFPKINLKI